MKCRFGGEGGGGGGLYITQFEVRIPISRLILLTLNHFARHCWRTYTGKFWRPESNVLQDIPVSAWIASSATKGRSWGGSPGSPRMNEEKLILLTSCSPPLLFSHLVRPKNRRRRMNTSCPSWLDWLVHFGEKIAPPSPMILKLSQMLGEFLAGDDLSKFGCEQLQTFAGGGGGGGWHMAVMSQCKMRTTHFTGSTTVIWIKIGRKLPWKRLELKWGLCYSIVTEDIKYRSLSWARQRHQLSEYVWTSEAKCVSYSRLSVVPVPYSRKSWTVFLFPVFHLHLFSTCLVLFSGILITLFPSCTSWGSA